MHSRGFWLRRLDLNIGDTVYYVIGDDASYSIKKARIVGVQKRVRGAGVFPMHSEEYTVYRTDDGRLINDSFWEKKDELDASRVYLSKDEAVQFIIHCLRCEINSQKRLLLDAQKRLAQAERVLKMYEKYGK